MIRSSQRSWLLPFAALVLLSGAVLLVASACSDSDSSSGDAEIINAINILDTAGLHDIDESISTDKTIPPTARTTAQKLQAVTELTEWPDDLQDDADSLVVVFKDMAAALDGDAPDMTKAGEAAKKAHDAQHDFSHDVWAHLYSEAGIETGEESHD